MAGLGPAIHVLIGVSGQDVDARAKPGHDGWDMLRGMATTRVRVRRADKAMQELMATGSRATEARYDRRRDRVIVALGNGLELAFPPYLAEGLAQAVPADLAKIEITPTGLGLHWPRLDADLYLPALIAGVFGSARWMAGLLGSKGGRARSSAKARAARINGQRGGRPRKSAGG